MTSDTEKPCPVCNDACRQTAAPDGRDTIWNIECPRCCRYEVLGTDILALRNAFTNDRQRANASGWIREHFGIRLGSEDIRRLQVLPTPTVGERARKLFRNYARRYPHPGIRIKASIIAVEDMARAWALDDAELQYIVKNHLIDGVKWLEDMNRGSISGGAYEVVISPAGWEHLESGPRVGHSDAIFVAMWFHADVSSARTSIERAITASGYDPIFIDSKNHENLIDNEILASIRASRLVVADFTGQRGGAYFEAGFAMGLGLPVIRTCRKTEERVLHFDVNHYNILFWDDSTLATFERDLRNRIVAAAGVGPRGSSGSPGVEVPPTFSG